MNQLYWTNKCSAEKPFKSLRIWNSRVVINNLKIANTFPFWLYSKPMSKVQPPYHHPHGPHHPLPTHVLQISLTTILYLMDHVWYTHIMVLYFCLIEHGLIHNHDPLLTNMALMYILMYPVMVLILIASHLNRCTWCIMEGLIININLRSCIWIKTSSSLSPVECLINSLN